MDININATQTIPAEKIVPAIAKLQPAVDKRKILNHELLNIVIQGVKDAQKQSQRSWAEENKREKEMK